MSVYDHKLEDREDGLAHCLVCNGAEGSLPTCCPGRILTSVEQEDVYAGRLNYARGPMAPRPVWWEHTL